MNFFKKWMLNLLALIIMIILPVLCIYVVDLLVSHLGIWVLFIILLILVSLLITIKNLN